MVPAAAILQESATFVQPLSGPGVIATAVTRVGILRLACSDLCVGTELTKRYCSLSTQMPAPTETSPLLANTHGNASAAAEEAAYEAAAASAIESAFHGDVNASAFQVPATTLEEPEDTEAAVPEGVLVTETPMRADLFIVLAGMWIGTFLSALE